MSEYEEEYYQDEDELEGIELCGLFKRQTAKAYLITIDGKDDWYPRSQIQEGDFEPDQLQPGMKMTFVISPWLAQQKGFL